MKNLLILIVLLPAIATAQFEDFFTDGNITENPQWIGNTSLFKVNDDKRLQLDDDEESSAYLSTASTRLDSTEWHFWIRLGFSPSSNNNARVYLAADQGNPNNPGKSYFLQFGESGSDDAITLFERTETGDSMICRGTEGLISSSFSMAVKVTCNSSGVWKIFTDPVNSGLYQLEASGHSEGSFEATHFSVFCNYTISNSDKFFFDDFIVKPLEKDTTPPALEEVETPAENEIIVHFDEVVSETSAQNPANFHLNQGIGQPDSSMRNPLTSNQVHLYFSEIFQNQTTYVLSVENIEDLSGNQSSQEEISFEYLKPQVPEAFDVVINEVLADVNPEPNNLPPYDYAELFNRTNNLVDLSGATLSFGAHNKTFPPETYIRPNSYLLITDDDSPLNISSLIYFNSFPVNNETRMTLKSAEKNIIHTINYQKKWYGDENKEEGGWSLEIIDPDNPCGCADNWGGSVDEKGGTPGNINSIDSENPDNTAPEITYLKIQNDSSLKVTFSESMDSISISGTELYKVENLNLQPQTAAPLPPDYSSVILSFEKGTFRDEEIYVLTISGTALDCSGNQIDTTSQSFANYDPHYGDLIIQEIMADINPQPRELPPAEYLEIYNRSDFPVDLTSISVNIGDKQISFEEGKAIEAGGYLVVSEEHANLSSSKDLYLVPSLRITNAGDAITLRKKHGEIIFYTDFELFWYDDETKQEGGWSLEMIDPNNFCSKSSNWSASTNPSGGTPGFENSVKTENADIHSPDIYRIAVVSPSTVRLYFNERIDSATLMNTNAYSVNPSLGALTAINPVDPAFEAVELSFEDEIQSDIIYSITASNSIKDCMNNGLLVPEALKFSYPILADTNDVVINEILFNPREQGVDFLELYNKSSHAIDLSSLFVELNDPLSGETEKKVSLTQERLIFVKNSYLALTQNPEVIRAHYPKAVAKNLLKVDDLPNFPNSGGQIQISDVKGTMLDRMIYKEDMHFPLIRNTNGVSLERVSTDKSSNDEDNWHSASETAGFATPGYANSQSVTSEIQNMDVTVSPEIVTPNNDGQNDQVQISYKLPKPGYSANVIIYDARGREVIKLFSNKQLATSGRFFWDGTNADKKQVQTGHYIILIELFDLEGNIEHYKKTVIIAGH
ncbi:MAG: lamin tail domain-containing protein [Bacteroidales bacterium]|nr:lamin tail domain-containing protein [Bacteroidales bacterium]MCF8332902.1 lamin tail domain-containing protein [Bacteroidales bacterium]